MAIRLASALLAQNFLAPDEVAQYLDLAHLLVYHSGPVPWEYQTGLRSWLIPGAIAGPLWLAKALGASPLIGLMFVRVILSVISLSIVWCACQWGRIYNGTKGAWIAGLLAAFWPDLWLMAPHPLEEALGSYALLAAAYCVSLQRVLPAAFLLGLAFVLREQLAPAIAIIGLWLCSWNPRIWLRALPMAALPVLLVGGLDWLSWGQPFRSFWLNIYINLCLGVAKNSSASPASYYLLGFLVDWLWALPLVFILAWRGALRLPILGVAALSIIVEHSLFAHKELRYAFPAIALLVPLVGVGLAGLQRPFTKLVPLGLISGLLISPFLASNWSANRHAFQLYADIASQHPCLVAVEVADTHFMPIVPLFGHTNFTTAQDAAQADIIVAEADATITPGFTRQSCITRDPGAPSPANPLICSWKRNAPWCTGQAAAPFQFETPDAARRFIIPNRFLPVT